MHQNK